MFKQYIFTFSATLQSIPITDFHIESYPAQYLQLLISQRIYYLHIYAQVLQKIVQYSIKPKEEMVLLDYGAGNGLLGMFAKHCGFKTVYSVDINTSFVYAAQFLNRQLKNPVDAILTGDWDTIVHFCKTHPIPDAVAGTDVIEHIYDVGNFLKNIKALNATMITVFTTASVTANPFKTYTIKKLQQQDEYKWSNPQHTSSDNPYAGLPFLEVRKRIIQEHFNLPEHQVTTLASVTRGMNTADILQAATTFIHTKQLPTVINHPTNTCDPVTGSWTEQLLTIEEYQVLYKNAGFNLTVYNGVYNEWQQGLKSLLLKILNRYILFTSRFGRWLSAYIVLVGK
ncbi:class I SAM-dependent methyltransferase [Ilyomonas limi]|uniref:Class I SAM-dependent methyltransferase n=1 Tax=Ilyomonas limi TaxID=2575867 RepID=A0A4U3KPX3_9BACT|nr:class I SAM-dependent methyltransferase [Ilyomonas limi]TKK64151.1 class I SAM-dependent methyltransferase [Ilyomonas limi]